MPAQPVRSLIPVLHQIAMPTHGTATPDQWHDTALLQAEAAQVPGQPSNVTCFRAKLEAPLKSGSSIDLEWYSVHVGLMTPFPAKASQSDPQRVLLKGSHYAPSPYPISTQITKASLEAVAHTCCLPRDHELHHAQHAQQYDVTRWACCVIISLHCACPQCFLGAS